MNQPDPAFRKPNLFERILNGAFGTLVRFGLGLRHNYLLEVRGRKTDRVYSTPVDLLEFKKGASLLLREDGHNGSVTPRLQARLL
jgi:hypothetical protein